MSTFLKVFADELINIGVNCEISSESEIKINGHQNIITQESLNAIVSILKTTDFGLSFGAMNEAMREVMVRGCIATLRSMQSANRISVDIERVSVVSGHGPDNVFMSVSGKENPLPGVDGHSLILSFQVLHGDGKAYVERNFGLEVDEITNNVHTLTSHFSGSGSGV